MKRTLSQYRLLMPLLLGVVASSLAALPAQADEWSKTYTLTGKPDLRVDTSDANIHVTTWDQNTIEARVTTCATKSATTASASTNARTAIRSSLTSVTRTTTASASPSTAAIIAWISKSTCRTRAAWTCTPAMAR